MSAEKAVTCAEVCFFPVEVWVEDTLLSVLLIAVAVVLTQLFGPGSDPDLDFWSTLVLFGKRGHSALLSEFIQLPHLVRGNTPQCVVTAKDRKLQLTGEKKSAFSVERDGFDSSTKRTCSPAGVRLMSDNCLQVIKWINKIAGEPVIKPFQCAKYQLCDG